MGLMNAENTGKSLRVEVRTGTLPQLSERVAVVASTQTDKTYSGGLEATPETVTILTGILLGLLSNTLSGDVIYLSMGAARAMCRESGVSDEEFERVGKVIMAKWAAMKSRNPMASMF
jgi:hypothetical protein